MYRYTDERLREVETKIMQTSALEYPLLEPADHEKVRDMIEEKRKVRLLNPLEGDIRADYQQH